MPDTQQNSIPYGLKMPWQQDASSSASSNSLPYGLTPPWEDNSNTSKTSAPAQPQHSVGYNKALVEASKNPNSLSESVIGSLASQNPLGGLALSIPGAKDYTTSALHGFLYNTLPILQGATNALGTAVANTASKIGLGKGAGYSAGEAYQAGRDASQNALDAYQQAHPILATGANLGGALANPVADLIPGLPEVKVATALGKAAKLGIAAAKTGAAGAAYGAGDAASRGESLPQIGESALTTGATSALAGPAAELVSPLIGKGVSALSSRVTAPTLKAATRIGGMGVGGALAGAATGVPLALLTGKPDAIINNAEWGFLGGAGYGARGVNKSLREPSSTVMPENNSEALQEIVNTVGNGDYGKTASILEASPEKTVAQAIEPSQRQQLMQTSGFQHEDNLKDLQKAIAQHQHPDEVKERLANALETASGSNPTDISDFIAAAPTQEANNLAFKAEDQRTQALNNAEALPTVLKNQIEASGLPHPDTAELDYQDYLKNHKETVSAPIWSTVDQNAPLYTEEHQQLLENNPLVREALNRATNKIGEGSQIENPDFVENPEYKPGFKTAENLTPEDFQEVAVDRRGGGSIVGQDVHANERQIPQNVPSVSDPKAVADYLNNKHGLSPESEPSSPEVPKYIPTVRAWLKTQTDLNSQVARNPFTGEPLTYSNNPLGHPIPKDNSLNNKFSIRLNQLNKENVPNLIEAKAASGDEASGGKNAIVGRNLGNKNGQSWQQHRKNFANLDEGDKNAQRYGYAQQMSSDFAQARNSETGLKSFVDKYTSEGHREVQKTLLGDEQAAELQSHLEDARKVISEAKASSNLKQETPVSDTIKKAQSLYSSDKPSSAVFDHAYDSDPDKQHLYKDAYTARLNEIIHAINNGTGNIEPEHLNQLKAIVDNEGHQHIQDRLYGPEKAVELRQAIRNEIKAAEVGKEISNFKPEVKEPKKFFNAVPSMLFGMAGEKHTPSGAVQGAMTGLKIAKGEQTIHDVAHALEQSKLPPATARAVGIHLASSPQELAAELRANETKKRNMPMSKSDIGKRIGSKAALGVGLITGKKISNALTGVDTNQ